MIKRDLKKELSEFYALKKGQITIVKVPSLNYLMKHGFGNPNTSLEYKEAVEALYALSYHIKFKLKKGLKQIEYGVMPLEGQWWTDDMNEFSIDNKDIWKWNALIMQPDIVTKEIVDESILELAKKKQLPSLQKVKFSSQEDGLSAQILHIGPYAEEPPTIQKLHNFISENGFEFNGKHREIYLNDPRRSAPEKLKTIIRQPIRKK